MFKVVEKSEDSIKILDTSDGSVDVCSLNDIKEYIRLRISIAGVLSVHGNVLVARIEEDSYKGLKSVFNRNEEQDWNSDKLKVTEKATGTKFEFNGFNSFSSKSDIYARYEGYINKQYICSLDECVRTSSTRVTIPCISYYAIFDESKNIVRYISCDNLEAKTRTRGNKRGNGSFIDIKSEKDGMYYCNVLTGDNFLDKLVSIMVLNNGDIVYVTVQYYEGKNDNGEFSKTKFTTRIHDMSNGTDRTVHTFWESEYEDCDLGVDANSVVEIYGSNIIGKRKLAYGSLSSFIDTYII